LETDALIADADDTTGSLSTVSGVRSVLASFAGACEKSTAGTKMNNIIGEHFILDISVPCRISGSEEFFTYGFRQRPASKGLEFSV
jgi:hypothetical protein